MQHFPSIILCLLVLVAYSFTLVQGVIKTSAILGFGFNNNGKFGQAPTYAHKTGQRHTILEQILFDSDASMKQAALSNSYSNGIIPVLSHITGGRDGVNSILHVKYIKQNTLEFVNQTIFSCGYSRNLTHIPVTSTPTPSLGFTSAGASTYGDERLTNNEIISLSCKYSCIAVNTQGLTFIKWYNETVWKLLDLPSTFKDPISNNDIPLNVKQVVIAVKSTSNANTQETILILTNSGFVLSFGYCNDGLRGDSTSDSSFLSVTSYYTFPTLSNISSIGTGPGVAFAINSTGSIFLWGSNQYGILNDPDTNILLSTPKNLEVACPIKKPSCGSTHCMYLCADGRVFGNGMDNLGQISGTYASMVTTPQEITSSLSSTLLGDTIVDISSSDTTNLALTSTGKVATWGEQTQYAWGRSGMSDFGLAEGIDNGNVVKAFFVYNIGIAITSNNQTYYWGSNSNGEACLNDLWFLEKPTSIANLSTNSQSHVKTISTRGNCGMLLSTDESSSSNVTFWGNCEYGLSGTNEAQEFPTTAATFDNLIFNNEIVKTFSLFRDTAGIVTTAGNSFGWGMGNTYQLGDENSHNTPVQLSVNSTDIAISSQFTIIAKKDSLYGLGSTASGAFGSTDSFYPSLASINIDYVLNDGSTVAQVACLESVTYILTSSGKLYGAGSNENGFISNNQTASFTSFVRIMGDDLPDSHKIRKIILFPSSPLLLISYEGDAYYIFAGIHKLNLPYANDSFVIHASSYEFTFYTITKMGNIYAMGGDNSFLEISQDYNVKYLGNLTLYATKESLGGVPYYLSADKGMALVALSNGWTCNGINSTASTVCSSNGVCADQDSCICKSGYFGTNCEIASCQNIRSDNSSVCSGRGTCSSLNNCTCTQQGYSGSNCENFTCGGIYSNNGAVCSGRGQCIKYNTCSCTMSAYFGSDCQYKSCFSDSGIIGTGSVLSVKNKLCRDINKYLITL